MNSKLPKDKLRQQGQENLTLQELKQIELRGAKEHNLKNIDIDIPKKKFVVVTGVSGSGKSSLALDTIFAEGQRRFIESLSSYARQFLGQLEKPKFETLRGLSPTISIEQKAASRNPRSTVGTITEIYDYLRVLYARLGVQFCHICGKKVGRGNAQIIVNQICEMPEKTRIHVLVQIVENRKGEHRDIFQELKKEGFVRVRVDGQLFELQNVPALSKTKKHNIEVVIDRLIVERNYEFKSRLTDSVETALRLGNGSFILNIPDREDIPMSEKKTCCGFAFPELEPTRFSFNSPLGMCTSCNGLGHLIVMDEAKVIADPNLSPAEGTIIPWKNYFLEGEEVKEGWGGDQIRALEKQFNIDFSLPWKKIPKAKKEILLYGTGDHTVKIHRKGKGVSGYWSMKWQGLLPTMMRRYEQTDSEMMKDWYSQFLSSKVCEECHGQRLRSEILAVKFQNVSISEMCRMTISEALDFFGRCNLSEQETLIGKDLINEICSRLKFLVNVGLDYLSLDRQGPTLSGGEAQRIRLAAQLGAELTGVLYVLDEPSIGLHQRDNLKLIETFKAMRDIGNSVLVIEHDQETIASSDWVVDVGPGAGRLGGEIVFSGPPSEIVKSKVSLTGQYLSGKIKIEVPKIRRSWKQKISILGAKENNLKNINVEIPVGVMTCFTGVSGAGKSSLINQILYPALSNYFFASGLDVGRHEKIEGFNHIDKVISIDQNPIGRTPRSNPATYTKVFDLIRDVFALLPESRSRGYDKGRFSFNVKGGRCENCTGDGFIRVEMHFLADVLVPCEVCKGQRFNSSTLEVKYKTHSIANVLEMTAIEAKELFAAHPQITKILDTVIDVGLAYLKLGQPATTLSGGEAQRIKLARELAKKDTGRTLYILDEPTTGLHFEDIRKLLVVLDRLVQAGNTIVVIEHNLDVIKTADWIVDLGPEGGAKGGFICAQGTPESVANNKKSITGAFLRQFLLKTEG